MVNERKSALAQASEATLRELTCLRLVHGRHQRRAAGLERFRVLESLTLLHSYLVPDDGNDSFVYQVPFGSPVMYELGTAQTMGSVERSSATHSSHLEVHVSIRGPHHCAQSRAVSKWPII